MLEFGFGCGRLLQWHGRPRSICTQKTGRSSRFPRARMGLSPAQGCSASIMSLAVVRAPPVLDRWRRPPARRCSPAVERIGLGEEAAEDVIDQQVVLLLERGVRDAGHDGEL